jgi:hypothetical protein
MRATIGLFLFAISFIALIFLVYREVNFIWYILLTLLTILGARLIMSSAGKRIATIEKEIDENLEKLKASSEIIKPDFDNCEFKDRSYSHEVRDENLSDLSSFTLTPYPVEILTTENVGQSALIYNHTVEGRREKFIQAFPFSADTLKFYVLNNNITLYVDHFDRKLLAIGRKK